VFGGLLSITVCEYLGFRDAGPRFWLFDTFCGIPIDQLPPEDLKRAKKMNAKRYDSDVFPLAKRNFEPYPSVRLVKGALPLSLSEAAELERIAYLSIDLNNALAERNTMLALWDKMVPGALIVIDDYGHNGHLPQYDMWNEFAHSRDRRVVTLPTSQGLLIK
jgi:hypothetical protein